MSCMLQEKIFVLLMSLYCHLIQSINRQYETIEMDPYFGHDRGEKVKKGVFSAFVSIICYTYSCTKGIYTCIFRYTYG